MISSTNKSDRYDIAVILLKVRMNTITITPAQNIKRNYLTDLNIK
jgi:hypothetical protein